MPELPGRRDVDQLRRRARELLRAAADGEPSAVAALHVVSQRITLSAAQLAVAREYGFSSWPALRTEAERLRSAEPSDAFEDRWSFGGASSIETAAGMLHPVALTAGPDHATLDITLMPRDDPQDQLAAPALTPSARRTWTPSARRTWTPSARRTWASAAHAARRARFQAAVGEVTVIDGRGTDCALRTVATWGPSGDGRGLISMRLELDPVPSRECGWVELRGRDRSRTRLTPSTRPAVRVSQVAPVPGSPAEREVSDQALEVIRVLLTGSSQDGLEQACSAALTRVAEMRQSGGLDAASVIPRQLAQLCASLTGHRPLAGVPRGWSGMVSAGKRADGAPHHLDIATDLPRVQNTALRVDSLISERESWRIYLRARPSWWIYSDDWHSKWAAVSVHAEDDLGGMYLTEFGGSTEHGGYAELSLRFLPRLDPLARALKLTFTAAGKQVALEFNLG